MSLTTAQFKINTPMDAQMEKCAAQTTCAQGARIDNCIGLKLAKIVA